MEDNMTIMVNEGLRNYFNALRNFGYKSYNEVNKLILLIMIEEIVTNKHMKYFISEENYRDIENALQCMMGTSCLVPYPKFINDDFVFIDEYYNAYYRILEQGNLRFIEGNMDIRILE